MKHFAGQPYAVVVAPACYSHSTDKWTVSITFKFYKPITYLHQYVVSGFKALERSKV